MNITGIIAEYNPFHNGHAYQLRKARTETDADYIIIVMSGNFVQRGAPALLDKYTRTKMALLEGADLVIELPAIWSSASAEYFAGAQALFCLTALAACRHFATAARLRPTTHPLHMCTNIFYRCLNRKRRCTKSICKMP